MKTCNRCKEEKPIELFSSNGKSGFHPVCKSCRSEQAREYRTANLEKVRLQDRLKYEANKAKKKQFIATYYSQNCDQIKQKNRHRYDQKKEQIKQLAKTYRQNNRFKVYEWNSTRRAAIRMALPYWADRKRIRDIYEKAAQITKETCVPHHVDHIIPLKHDVVCGLHVPENLQILPASENLAKQNKWNP